MKHSVIKDSWWLERESCGGRYITNFNKKHAHIYIQAISLSGCDFLEVREYPNPNTPAFNGGENDDRKANYFSLFSNVNADLTEFWKVFRNIESLAK